jgi:NDP-sugar pyrophosphorylase family protein
MRAMIFAAGLGTRLYPLTLDKPKALVEVAGKTLLQLAIEKVSLAGYHDLVINVHHFGDQIIRYLKDRNNFGLNITISDERDRLLDTGGGILKAAHFFDGNEAFLVSNIDLQLLRKYHIEQGGLATLVVRDRKTARYLAFDDTMQLAGWRNVKAGDEIASRDMKNCSLLAFSGIQLIEPAIFKLITETGCFPLIPLYLRLATEHRIMAYRDQSTLWMDLGKPDQIKEAEKFVGNRKF